MSATNYKGFEVSVRIYNYDVEMGISEGEKGETEQSLAVAICRYMDVFGEIPKPMGDISERDSPYQVTVQDAYLNFHDMDGEPWTIRYVNVHPKKIQFIVSYAM